MARTLVSRLLPRFLQAQDDARSAQALAPILIETGRPIPRQSTTTSDPGDALLLRGIPAVGGRGGVGGAISGTRPGTGRRLDSWSPSR